MTLTFLLIQLISLVAYIIGTLGYWKKRKKDILIYSSISNILFALHYGLLGGIGAVISNGISFFRNLLYIKFENKSNRLPLLFIVLYLIFGCVFFRGFISIIPLIIALIQTFFLVSKKENIIRISGIMCSLLWIIYNIYIKSYIGIILEIGVIISTMLAILKVGGNYERRKNNSDHM